VEEVGTVIADGRESEIRQTTAAIAGEAVKEREGSAGSREIPPVASHPHAWMDEGESVDEFVLLRMSGGPGWMEARREMDGGLWMNGARGAGRMMRIPCDTSGLVAVLCHYWVATAAHLHALQGFGLRLGMTKRVRSFIKVTTPKCDTCFSLVMWEGVVQKIYRQGD
jgi:hypothetical protein